MLTAADWFVVGMKYIASVSFGKDSLAMLLRLIEEKMPLDTVVFYNTGMEFESIYHIRDKMKPILKTNGIEYVELHPEEPFLFAMFEKKIKYRKQPGYHYGYQWCGGPCRWGTHEKLVAIKRYKKSLEDDVTDYVGIAFDESRRFEKAKVEGKTLPLVQWKMKEQDCLQFCHTRGWSWVEDGIELYDILDRVSCWCCANKNYKELENIYLHLPKYWQRLRNFQAKMDRPMKGFYKGEPRGVFELEERFKNKR